MVQITKYIIGLGLALLSVLGCSNGESLQRYLVDKQEDDNFVKVDVAASLLQTKNNTLTEKEKEILKTIKKVNVVAFPIGEDNRAEYEVEKVKVAEILEQEAYKTLMKMGSNNKGASLKYLGDEDAIDELIVFASDEERGFALFRLLGKNMRPDQMIELMHSIDKGDLDISQFSGIGELFEARVDYETASHGEKDDMNMKVEVHVDTESGKDTDGS